MPAPGNTPLEVFAAVAERQGIRTGLDVLQMIDVAEDVVRPVMDGECVKDRLAIIMGYAGVYSSYLKHAYRAAERYGVSGAEILLECGRQGLVGGQEDQIIQIAAALAARGRSMSTVSTVVTECADIIERAVRERTAIGRLTDHPPRPHPRTGLRGAGRGGDSAASPVAVGWWAPSSASPHVPSRCR